VLVAAGSVDDPFPILLGRLDASGHSFEAYATDGIELDQLQGLSATYTGAVWMAGLKSDSFETRVLRYNASGELTLKKETGGPFMIPTSMVANGAGGAIAGETGSEIEMFAVSGMRPDGTPYGDEPSSWLAEDGTALTLLGNNVHLMPDGTVAAVLGLRDPASGWAIGVVTLDADLHEMGRFSTDLASGNTALLRSQNDAHGRTVVALARSLIGVAPLPDTDVLDLMRFLPDGSVDPAFPRLSALDVPNAFEGALAVTRPGEILLVAPAAAGVALTRFDATGARIGDTTIDLGGQLTQIEATTDFTSGRVLVAGVTAEKSAVILALHGDDSGRFLDDDRSVHETSIDGIAELGITTGCNPPYRTNYCPKRSLSRAETATVLVRALDLPAADHPSGFVDIGGSVHAANIDALAAAGITKGCNPPANDRYCPSAPINRGEMATMLVRAFGMTAADGYEAVFVDIASSVHAANIDVLASNRVTLGCNPPDNDRFCPHAQVTRAQSASFLLRALESVP
jgi:hypothetical protein